MKHLTSAALALAMAATTGALAQTVETGEVIALSDWRVGDLYTEGWSAEEFIDEMEVVGTLGEEIGDVEDLLVGPDGTILAVVAEVGGVWDIGDTHVSIPWSDVTVGANSIEVPLSEENAAEYDYFEYSGLAGSKLGEEVVAGVDDAATGQRVWRVSELIGDYARLTGDDTEVDYGYVSDVIFRDGKIAATVVDPRAGYGARGYYAYPYYGYGYGYGWEPGAAYYDMPYTEEEVADVEQLDYGLFE